MRSVASSQSATQIHSAAASVPSDLSLKIELARILLISSIVFHHIRIPAELSFFTWDNLGYIRGYLQIGIFKTATTALTVVSGYLLFSTRFEAAPAALIQKKFRTLLVPLVLWNIPGTLLLYYFHSKGLYLNKYADLTYLANWWNALLALTNEPVNTPLHFLRNLFACNIVALLIAGLFRKHALAGLILVFVIGVFDLDGLLLTRDDILISFFLGAFVAVAGIHHSVIDRLFPITAPAFLTSAFVMFYWQIDYETIFGLLHRLLSFFAIWPLIGFLARFDWSRMVAKKYAGFAFFTFLSHYYVSIGLFAVWSRFVSLKVFFIYFLIAGPVTIAICVAAQGLARWLAPSLLAVATGGRT